MLMVYINFCIIMLKAPYSCREAAAENLHGNMTRKMHIQELKGTQDVSKKKQACRMSIRVIFSLQLKRQSKKSKS